MDRKNDLIKNLQEYTPDQIAEAVSSGIVTMYELKKSGKLTPLKYKSVEEKLATKATSAPVKETYPTIAKVDRKLPRLTENDSVTEPVSFDYEEEVVIPKADEVYIPKADDTEPVSFDHEEEVVIPKADEVYIPKADVSQLLQEPIVPATSPTNASDSLPPSAPSSTKHDVISNKGMFKRPFSFKGRIRRLEYGISFIIYSVWNAIIYTVNEDPDPSMGASIFVLVLSILMIWFCLAQNCKRCHDRGNSGWYQLIPFYYLVLLFGKGEEGINNYGDNPKNKI